MGRFVMGRVDKGAVGPLKMRVLGWRLRGSPKILVILWKNREARKPFNKKRERLG